MKVSVVLAVLWLKFYDIVSTPNKNIEVILREKEEYTMSHITQELHSLGIKIRAFYHVSRWQGHWRAVVAQQLRILDGIGITRYFNRTEVDMPPIKYSILNLVDHLHISIAGLDYHYEKDWKETKEFISSLNLTHDSKIQYHYVRTIERGSFQKANQTIRNKLRDMANSSQITEGEVSTVNVLHEYCKNETEQNHTTYVLYFHSKSGCCPPVREGDSKVHWRDKMNLYILEYPSLCIRSLLYGYVACGTDLLTRNWAHAHFAGNFWWSHCNHIASLPAMSDFHLWQESEFFILNVSSLGDVRDSFGQHCSFHVSPFGGHATGQKQTSREEYLGHISRNFFSRERVTRQDDELQNEPPGKTKTREWVQQYCADIWQTSYMDQISWDVGLTWW